MTKHICMHMYIHTHVCMYACMYFYGLIEYLFMGSIDYRRGSAIFAHIYELFQYVCMYACMRVHVFLLLILLLPLYVI